MAINPVTQSDSTAVASNTAVAPVSKETTPSQPQPAAKDTVQISSAALAAVQEATETSTQTAKEARGGDIQAQRLQAKEAAAAEEAKEAPAARAQETQRPQEAQATTSITDRL